LASALIKSLRSSNTSGAIALALLILALTWALPQRADAQTFAPPDDTKAILNELRAIRQLLERTPPPQAPGAAAPQPNAQAKVSLTGAYMLGRPDAPVTLVEFTDYECPFCRQFHMSTFEELKKNHIDTGKLRYVSRDFPLDMHRSAFPAARAARCAGEQGKFWEMRHTLIVNANALSPEAMHTFARDLRLDAVAFRACLEGDHYSAEVKRDLSDGQTAGVSGTPTFVIGRSTGDSVEGLVVVGAQGYAAFDARIRELLPAGQ
jgi:protein-disulfide isomerase